MTLHSNARTCPRSRRLLADRVLVEGWSLAAAAEAAGVSERTAWKWVDRFRREGEAGLEDRSSAPVPVPSRTPADREELIVSLRELRFTSPEIAETLGMPLSTVGAVLARHGLGKLPRLAAGRAGQQLRAAEAGRARPHRREEARPDRPARPPRQRRPPDRRRGIGWEFVHVAVDDATRLAYVEVLDDEKGTTAAGFLRRAVALLPPLRDPRRARPDRQRLLLPRGRARARLHDARHPPPAHPPLPAAHERESRALHPHPRPTAGPTAPSTAPAANAPPPSPAGSTGTTDSDHTAHSAENHPSPGSPR